MRTIKRAPIDTLNPRPQRVLFLSGLPLSRNRNTRLEPKLIKTNISKIKMIVFNTGILKH
tara:strand:- start:440 stop:619 length:180 start_codon:yes stop_codon:yes gene_type:complete